MGSVSHPNLFGIETKKRSAAAKKEPVAPGAVHKLISIYAQAYEQKFHEPPVILKSDGPLLRNLVQQFGALKVEQRLRAFMTWDDQFVIDSGYSLRMLHTRWNALAAKVIQERPAERGPVRGADATDQYLSKLRASTR